MSLAKKFFIYRNLRTKTWSEKASNGRVTNWPVEVIISNPKMVVSSAGRMRVLSSKRKNVHAGIRGQIVSSSTLRSWDDATIASLIERGFREVTYNPHIYESFVFADTKEPVFNASSAYMTADMKVYVL